MAKNLDWRTTQIEAACVKKLQREIPVIIFFQNLLSSLFLPKGMQVTMHRPITSPVFLYGCKTWSVAWEKESRLRGFENMVLRKVFESKKKKKVR
jgi:hypothetical protein